MEGVILFVQAESLNQVPVKGMIPLSRKQNEGEIKVI